MADLERIRLVVLGGAGVGKSAIIRRLLGQGFSERYRPTVEDLYSRECVLGTLTLKVDLLDTAGKSRATCGDFPRAAASPSRLLSCMRAVSVNLDVQGEKNLVGPTKFLARCERSRSNFNQIFLVSNLNRDLVILTRKFLTT